MIHHHKQNKKNQKNQTCLKISEPLESLADRKITLLNNIHYISSHHRNMQSVVTIGNQSENCVVYTKLKSLSLSDS